VVNEVVKSDGARPSAEGGSAARRDPRALRPAGRQAGAGGV